MVSITMLTRSKGFIDKGDEVEVVRYENFQLYVRRKR